MSVPTVSEVLRMTNLDVTDRDVTSTCLQCRGERPLSDCWIQEEGRIRSYRCRVCSGLVVEVGRAGSVRAEMGSYQVEDWVIRPTVDLFAHVRGHKIRI